MEILKSINTKKENCIHTRNITMLFDLNPKDDQYQIYQKHLTECNACKKTYNHFAEEMKAIQVFIPKAIMEKDIKESFEREIHEVLVSLDLDIVSKQKNAWWIKFNAIGEQVLKSFWSKTMLWGFVLALVSYILLKFN